MIASDNPVWVMLLYGIALTTQPISLRTADYVTRLVHSERSLRTRRCERRTPSVSGGVDCSIMFFLLIYNLIDNSKCPPKPSSTIFCNVENLASFTLFSILEI